MRGEQVLFGFYAAFIHISRKLNIRPVVKNPCGASLKKSEAHNRCVPTVHKPHATLPVARAHTLLLIPRLASLPAVAAIGR